MSRISLDTSGPSQREGLDELYKLSAIIQESIKKIDTALSAESLDFPLLNTPFTRESEVGRELPEVRDATVAIAAAATQLNATVLPPQLTNTNTALSFNLTAAVGAVVESHAPEVLRAAGPKGLHVEEIAKPSGVDPAKLARLLRLAATYHIFREVSPDVFAHNRLSSLLDTGKPIEVILKDPKNKYTGASGQGAQLGHCSDEGMKIASYLTEAVTDPVSGHANDFHDIAFNRAFNTKKSLYEMYDEPQQAYRTTRFAAAMEGVSNSAPPKATIDGMDWAALGQDALVVDVGGGQGTQSLVLSKNCPNLKLIVQDRESVRDAANGYWEKENPEAWRSGRASFQVHDFFGPQNIKDADIFFVRTIIHNYPDSECITILRHLREAAKPTTQLIIVDAIMAYACEDPSTASVPGATLPLPPAPLLPNFGEANAATYLLDIYMMGFSGGIERTLPQVQALLEASGWKMTRVHHGASSALTHQKIFAIPA